MPTSHTKQLSEQTMTKNKRRELPVEAIDQILKAGYSGPKDFTGPDGFLQQLVAAVVNRALNTKLDHHLG